MQWIGSWVSYRSNLIINVRFYVIINTNVYKGAALQNNTSSIINVLSVEYLYALILSLKAKLSTPEHLRRIFEEKTNRRNFY